MSSVILGCGSYLPARVLSNKDLESMVDTTDEWIVTRTGIQQRHIARDDELTSDMAVEAAKDALQKAKLNPEDIDVILVATTTPDLTFPATAVRVQAKLAAANAFAFDMQAVCSGFVYAMSMADHLLSGGQYRRALVIGVDKMSSILDWEDRNTCVLFGDGAGAVVMEAKDGESRGVLGFSLYSNGTLDSILCTSGGVATNQQTGVVTMQGQEVFRHAVQKLSDAIEVELTRFNCSKDDIDLLVPHQANIRIIDGVGKRMKLPKDKVLSTVDKHANTSAASIPLALAEASKQGLLNEGDLVCLAAIGGGLTWGAGLIRW